MYTIYINNVLVLVCSSYFTTLITFYLITLLLLSTAIFLFKYLFFCQFILPIYFLLYLSQHFSWVVYLREMDSTLCRAMRSPKTGTLYAWLRRVCKTNSSHVLTCLFPCCQQKYSRLQGGSQRGKKRVYSALNAAGRRSQLRHTDNRGLISYFSNQIFVYRDKRSRLVD